MRQPSSMYDHAGRNPGAGQAFWWTITLLFLLPALLACCGEGHTGPLAGCRLSLPQSIPARRRSLGRRDSFGPASRHDSGAFEGMSGYRGAIGRRDSNASHARPRRCPQSGAPDLRDTGQPRDGAGPGPRRKHPRQPAGGAGPVPAGIYGIFMEEISHAFDGGIYAELIQNRSFEEGVLPPGMKLVKKDGRQAEDGTGEAAAGRAAGEVGHALAMVHELRLGPQPRAGRLVAPERGRRQGADEAHRGQPHERGLGPLVGDDVAVPGAKGRVDLVNSGYWGINVKAGTTTTERLPPPGHYQGEVTAMLEVQGREVLAVTNSAWSSPANRGRSRRPT